MVVSLKRKESRLGKKSCSNHVANLRPTSGHVNSKESLGSRNLKNEVGLSGMSKNKGKRKAQVETSLNLLSKEQVNAKDLMSTSLGHDRLKNLDRFNHGSVIVKPNSISVKGKKDFARSRALYTNSSQIGRTKGIKNTNTKWMLSIYTI